MLSLSEPEIVRGWLSKWKEKSVKTVVPVTFVKKKFFSLGHASLGSGKRSLQCILPQTFAASHCPAEEGQLAIFLPPAQGASCGGRPDTQISSPGRAGSVLTALEGIRGRE